ncbi:MAG: hypothetical protein ACLFPX_05620 [Candidatus Omnitrophota bacterium]
MAKDLHKQKKRSGDDFERRQKKREKQRKQQIRNQRKQHDQEWES